VKNKIKELKAPDFSKRIKRAATTKLSVSILLPCYNASATISEAILSVLKQDFSCHIQVVAVDDCSSDGTLIELERWRDEINRGEHGPLRSMVVKSAKDVSSARPHGPAAARNRAAKASSGAFFCLLDSDDVCFPNRVRVQMQALLNAEESGLENVLVGARFTRIPKDSSPTYTQWANSLSPEELYLQSWRECTLVQPTWFMRRQVFERIGGYDEIAPPLFGSKSHDEARWNLTLINGKMPNTLDAQSTTSVHDEERDLRHPPILSRSPLTIEALRIETLRLSTPLSLDLSIDQAHPTVEWFGEDPMFFRRHLHAGGKIILADETQPLLVYRFSSGSISWKTPRLLLQRIRVAMFEEAVIFSSPSKTTTPSPTSLLLSSSFANGFSIWGAGRDGKAFYNALSPSGKRLVRAFCDIDERKIGQQYPQVVTGKKRKMTTVNPAIEKKVSGGEEEHEKAAVGVASGEDLVISVNQSTSQHHSAPIIHLSKACLPIVCCVNLESGGKELRDNAAKFFPGAREGVDLIYFV